MEGSDFFVEDLLDLSNGGDEMMTDTFIDSFTGHSTDSSSLTPVSDTCNSSVSPSFPEAYFSGTDICVPYDDMAELEWLSNFVEESDLHKLQFIPTNVSNQPGPLQSGPNPPTNVPAKARSKRSRIAPCDFSTRLLIVSSPSPATSSSETGLNPSPGPKKQSSKRRENGAGPECGPGEVRRCLHCAAEKTPQWRTGPMGPKTLCNACGVRYKSGRLVPEYRPAASPTFISTKHSNSHRKVMELRRQKEVHRHHHQHHHQQQQQFIGNGGNHIMMAGGEDYFNYHHYVGGTDYRQMI
ncbi:GATA transcription factor 12-like [Amaranthus tricolor]|uniref:GATA transcription factor 12-like n=1 Tax=Amaranthus tricolor TaxID=29722 RepID=UPI002588CBF7|nr:GATA transcription factor 12-like [Amaranthus tricolor]